MRFARNTLARREKDIAEPAVAFDVVVNWLNAIENSARSASSAEIIIFVYTGRKRKKVHAAAQKAERRNEAMHATGFVSTFL